MTLPDNDFLDQAGHALFQYDRWQAKFLSAVLRLASGFGLLAFITNAPQFGIAEVIAFSLIYASLLIMTFAPMPYVLRAGTLILVCYLIGAYSVLQFGPWSAGVAYLLAASIFASLLFDERMDRPVFAINFATLVLIGALNTLGYLPLASAKIPETTTLDWFSYAVDYFVVGIVLLWALNLLKSEFRTVADQFQSAMASLSKTRADLEKRVEERTAGLIRKTEQLRAASYIARQTAEIQNLDTVLKAVANLITDQFGFYHTGIFLMNETGTEVVLVSASSEGGKRMIEKGYSLKVGSQGIVGFVAAEKKPRIALDVGADAVYFNNPDLPMTRSEVAIPLVIRDKTLGVLDIQSDQPHAFSLDEIDVLQVLSDQLAAAIENARLLEDTQAALNQVEALTAVRTRESWSQKVREGEFTYTYTPLGLQAGKTSETTDQAVKIPITLRGQKIGTISIARKGNQPLSDIDIELINEVAYQTGLAVDNIRLVEDATLRAQQEELIGELAARFSQSTDIDILLQTAARELGQVADVAEVSVYVGEIPEQAPQRKRTRRPLG
ncbi:MAG: GAF domain-containing protein [Chloroflexi bacterium]|nr:GAF domain-containing protein [Chloroflexota bacterium]